jgi:hypothetical protein
VATGFVKDSFREDCTPIAKGGETAVTLMRNGLGGSFQMRKVAASAAIRAKKVKLSYVEAAKTD